MKNKNNSDIERNKNNEEKPKKISKDNKESKKEKYSNLEDNNILNKKIKKPKNQYYEKDEPKMSSTIQKTNHDKYIINNSYPKKFTYLKDFICDDFSNYRNFIIFKSVNDIYILIYGLINNSIILYNINDNKRINEIKNAHNKDIEKFKYYLDTKKKLDLVLSLADNELKVWNINNLECLFKFEYYNDNEDEENLRISANFLYNHKKVYVIIKFAIYDEPIKIYNLKGKKIKEIYKYNKVDFIDTFYDNKLSKTFIIIIKDYKIKSYDYNEERIYQNYYKGNSYYRIFITKSDDDKVKLIGIKDKCIKIWDFHTGEKLNKIHLEFNISFYCLWNNKYLLAGCKYNNYWDYCIKDDNRINGINLINGNINKNIIIYKNFYLNRIKKFNHPYYGECLLTQGSDDKIKIWTY